MSNLTVFDFFGKSVRFEYLNSQLWISLTDIADSVEIPVSDWIRQQSTIKYLTELEISKEAALKKYAYTLSFDKFAEAFSIFYRNIKSRNVKKEA